jgi:predicted Zn-dependent protease
VIRCASCRLPLAPSAGAACPACGEPGARPPQPLDRSIVGAAEQEVRVALADALAFVATPELTAYLERVARQQARFIDRSLPAPEVRIFDDAAVRTLALPSGILLLSHGALAAVEDEAELVFVLGHELGHIAGGEAGASLAALGLLVVAGTALADRPAWATAARAVMQLGHGDDREHAADARSHAALAAAGYDPDAALRYLERLRERMAAGAAEVVESGLAHPLPEDRRRRLMAARRQPAGPGRIDREVFRRVAGREVLARALRPARPFDEPAPARRLGRAMPRMAWIVLALVALGALLLVVL